MLSDAGKIRSWTGGPYRPEFQGGEVRSRRILSVDTSGGGRDAGLDKLLWLWGEFLDPLGFADFAYLFGIEPSCFCLTRDPRHFSSAGTACGEQA